MLCHIFTPDVVNPSSDATIGLITGFHCEHYGCQCVAIDQLRTSFVTIDDFHGRLRCDNMKLLAAPVGNVIQCRRILFTCQRIAGNFVTRSGVTVAGMPFSS